ncbi:MAG: alpha/beta hydrolase family protein, partial [Planctomycetota bacterium]
FLEVKTSDGVTLNALLLKPRDFDPTDRYPVICTTYGGPASQTVRNSWGGSGWLWSHMLTQKGFLVFWIDHRGCSDHGHQGAALMHRSLCEIEWQDQVEGIKYLRSLPYVAGDRIGIWGWSYGGTASVTCLLKAPDYFKAAVAVAPVLDFQNYDAIYTERYMDTPEENPEGYAGTRLSDYAKNMKGHLLLIHGLQDDNVLVQNTFQLAWALQDKGKQFRMMIYPKGGHGIGSSRIRVHMFEMITEFFMETLM